MTRSLTLALCLSLAVPTAGLQAETKEWPSWQYDEIGAKLMMRGYHDLNLIDRDTGMIHAYDKDGSEVMITVDEGSQQVLNVAYPNRRDQ